MISGNRAAGVLIVGTANGTFTSVEANYIGTNVAGNVALGNVNGVVVDGVSGVNIGGQATGTGAGNLISGNKLNGILIVNGASYIEVERNYIGTSAGGSSALGNGTGISIKDSSNSFVHDNLISGNVGVGVAIGGSSATLNGLEWNVIGTDHSRTAALGNGSHGVLIEGASNNYIGGFNLAAGSFSNLIAFNGGAGVFIASGAGNGIGSNSIHGNAGLGIDLASGQAAVTANDPGDLDVGANLLQNFPDLGRADSVAQLIQGTFQGTPNATFTLQFFASAAADPSGFGEGETYLGELDVRTDANGLAVFSFRSPVLFLAEDWITATATEFAVSNTSEFSQAVKAV